MAIAVHSLFYERSDGMNATSNWEKVVMEVRADRRRGKRVGMTYAITIRGLSCGEYFAEETRTTNVSEHGCCFETTHQLARGDIVSLEVRGRVHLGPSTFEVMRVSGGPDHWVIGAMLLETTNVWGMSFPQQKTA